MKSPRNRPDVSLAQVAGSALAAVSAAVVASFLGVGGTVIGAALGSVVATVGGAVYSHSFRQAGRRLGETRLGDTRVITVVARPRVNAAGETSPDPADVPVPVVESPTEATDPSATAAVARAPRWLSWKAALALAVAAFVLALAVIEVVELAIGHPLSGGSGTTVGQIVGGGHPAKRPSPTPTPSSTPTPTTTPSGSPTATVTVTTTPTTTPSDTATSSSATSTPSDSTTGAAG